MTDKSVGRVGVELELEAAETLTALCNHNDISAGEDDLRRFSHPFKNNDSTTPHDRSKVPRKNINNISSMVMHSERPEQEFNRINYRALGSGSCSKSRNYLTEDEREQRRIRRVLANRESARQTIRRRQAMYDQLIENAAVLEMENENLKAEKEQALSKFSSLKSMNGRLKDMLDKEAKATREQCGDPDLGIIRPSTSTSTPPLLCNQPSLPFFFPSIFHSSDGDSEQGMHHSNGVGAPVYVLPFPFFFPIQMQCLPQTSQPPIQYMQSPDVQNETCMIGGAVSSSQAGGNLDTDHASNAANMNSENTNVNMSASWDCGTGKQIAEELQEEDMVEMEAVSPSAWGLATNSEIPIHCPRKKSSGAAATAEARRRRKELTKLKRLYCRNQTRQKE